MRSGESPDNNQNKQINVLYEASQKLNSSLSLDDVYKTACEFMSIIAPNDGFAISHFDQPAQMILCRAYWMGNKWLDVRSFPPIPLEEEGKGTQSIVIRTGKSLLINDYQAQVKTATTRYFVDDTTNEITIDKPEDDDIVRSAMIVPLKFGGKVIGVIQVMSFRLNAYNEHQLRLLESLALHISSAGQNAQLFEQIQTELKERKNAEKALEKSVALKDAIIDNSPIGISVRSKTGKLLRHNSAWKKIWAITDEAILQDTTQEREKIQFNERDDYLKPFHNDIKRIYEKGGSFFIAEMATSRKKPNMAKWISQHFYSLPDADGNVDQVVILTEDITERKEAEEALRESELKYRLLIENTSDVVFCVNEKGAYQFTNRVFAATFNQSPEYFIGKTFWDVYPKEEADFRQAANERVFETGQIQSIEVTVPLPEKKLYFLAKANPIKDENGRVLLNLTTATDITERKRDELIKNIQYSIAQAVVATQELTELYETVRNNLSNLIDTTNFFIAFYDKENDRFSSPFERDEKDSIPVWPAEKSFTGYVLKQNKAVILNKNTMLKLIEAGALNAIGTLPESWLGVPFSIKDTITGVIVVQDYINPYAFDHHSVNLLSLIANQLSSYIERKQAEEALQESEKKHRILFDDSPDSYFILCDNILIDCNRSAIALFECERTNIIGKTIADFSPEYQPDGNLSATAAEKNVAETFKIGRKSFEWVHRTINGNDFWVDVSLSAMTMHGKAVIFASCRDITDRKNTEQKYREAEQKNTALALGITANHEINQPLMKIMGSLNLLEKKIEKTPEIQKHFDTITDALQEINDVLKIMRDVEKLEKISFRTYLDGQSMINFKSDDTKKN